MPQPDLSVCIVNWNTRPDLEEAVASVLASDPELKCEVIVLDNASRDGSAEMMRERFPGVRLLESPENVGFARGYNRAVGESKGRYILVLNPDTVVRPGALGRLIAFMEEEKQAGACGPRLLNSDGSIQYSCRRFPTPMAAVFRNTVLGRIIPRNHYTREYLMADWDHRAVREVDWISGAAMCIRREAWEEVGGFDEGFFMYAEDIDWCLRARQAGWKICYVPEAAIVHKIGRSSDQRPLPMVVQFHRSMARFYRKHYAPGWPWGLRWLPVLGVWIRAAVVMGQTLLRRERDRLRMLGGRAR
jgi:GT2 family glycosyltransferase